MPIARDVLIIAGEHSAIRGVKFTNYYDESCIRCDCRTRDHWVGASTVLVTSNHGLEQRAYIECNGTMHLWVNEDGSIHQMADVITDAPSCADRAVETDPGLVPIVVVIDERASLADAAKAVRAIVTCTRRVVHGVTVSANGLVAARKWAKVSNRVLASLRQCNPDEGPPEEYDIADKVVVDLHIGGIFSE